MKDQTRYVEILNGNWTNLPKTCGGNIEIWDQTVGCPECGMNLWYFPEYGQWPEWDKAAEPPKDWWDRFKYFLKTDPDPYEPYVKLFSQVHPFAFFDCYDPGDEDLAARNL